MTVGPSARVCSVIYYNQLLSQCACLCACAVCSPLRDTRHQIPNPAVCVVWHEEASRQCLQGPATALRDEGVQGATMCPL